MVIISKSALLAFSEEHSLATEPLNRWHEIAKNSNWRSFADLKRDFNSADSVGNDRYVFNIKGNDFRLVAMIHFDIRTIYIRFVGTHKQYDLINCKNV